MSVRRSCSAVMTLLAAATSGLAAVVAGARPPAAPPLQPRPMPTLPPAAIDDTLAIGGNEIAARKAASRMTVPVLVNQRGPYRFVVDSGADVSVVGTRLADTLALPAGRPIVLNAMTESALVRRAKVATLQLGPNTLEERELPVLNEADLGADGMLGIDSLARQRLMMDFDKRTIAVENAEKRPPRMDGEIVVVARRRRGQLILTQVSANRRPIDAVIDTGSEITVGNQAMRDLLIPTKKTAGFLNTVELTGVTGRPVTLQVARIAELKIGSIVFRNVPMAFADLPPFTVFGMTKQPALLLGTDLMEQFRRISLDFRARKVRFQLRRCTGVRIVLSTGYTSRLQSESNEVCRP